MSKELYMEKENLPDDEYDNEDEVGEESEEFHGDITEEQLERAEEIYFEEEGEALLDLEANEEIEHRTEYPDAPPMDELFDESDKKPDYDDEHEK
jgi:hypothetical protein